MDIRRQLLRRKFFKGARSKNGCILYKNNNFLKKKHKICKFSKWRGVSAPVALPSDSHDSLQMNSLTCNIRSTTYYYDRPLLIIW